MFLGGIEMDIRGKTALVTGGAGFVGSHIVDELVKEGVKVRVLDNFMRGRMCNLGWAMENGEVEVVKGNVSSEDVVRDAMQGVNFVFHEAANGLVYSRKYPRECVETNIVGTVNVILEARDAGVEKFVFASSASVYGNFEYIPTDEKHPLGPITPYCVSKMCGENFLRIYKDEMKHVIFRYFNVYGPRQGLEAYYTAVIPIFTKKMFNNEPITIDGDGTQSMDFVFVKDVARANVAAIKNESVSNDTFNLCGGTETSVNQMVEILKRHTGKTDLKVEHRKADRPVVYRRVGCFKKAKERLGFEPETSIDAGLKEVVEFVLEHKDDVDYFSG
jgi:UDP-glucose 4-epimerase